MSAIPFLNNRQIGAKPRSGFKSCYSNLNLDNVLLRLVCHKRDVFTVRGEESDVPPFSCKFRRDARSDLLAVANEDGDISIYDTGRKEQEKLKSFPAHHNAIFDICWSPDKYHVVSGSGDHNASLWDITYCKLISIFKKHTASVKSVDVCREQSAIFATGSRDGSINVWDTREKNSCPFHVKPVVSISQAHCRKNTMYIGKRCVQKDPVSSVSAVAFQDSNNLASAGVADGVVKIWDLRRTYVSNSKYLPTPRYRMEYSESGNTGHGCTSIVFDSRYKTLYACSTNHKILKFDCHSYTKDVAEFEGFRCATYFVKLALSSDDQYLLCGSSDDKAYIWKTSKPGLPVVQLAVHSAEVTSVCWSPYDITKLVTCGDDNKVAIWKVADTETVKIDSDVEAVAEAYSESPKNANLPVHSIFQRSVTISNVPKKKSPIQRIQTPSKPAIRSIKSFFSPVISPPVQASSSDTQTPVIQNQTKSTSSFSSITSPLVSSDIQNSVTVNDNSPSPSNKLSNKSPIADSSAQVLTPSNHANKSNIMHQPTDGNSETFSPELKNSSPENKNGGTSLNSSSSVQNKENTSTDYSPETVYKTNSIGQTKRKVTQRHSTPSIKRKQSEGSKRSKGLIKMDKKSPPGRTIMNYFSVALSPEN